MSSLGSRSVDFVGNDRQVMHPQPDMVILCVLLKRKMERA